MLNKLGWIGIVASLGLFAVACVPAESTESEETSEAAQALNNAGKSHDVGYSKSVNNKGKGSGKVEICHIPPGNPGNAHTIEVGQSAVSAHLAHGDHIGDCDSSDDGDGGDPGTQACGVDGSSCSSATSCCSNLCGGSGICTSSCVYGLEPPAGQPAVACSEQADCCSGTCISGYCWAGIACSLPGAPCDNVAGVVCCFDRVCGANGTCQ